MYRAIRTQLQPFCTTPDCNRSCHQVHHRNQRFSPPSVSLPADILKAKRNSLCRKNYSFANEIGTRSVPVLTANDNSGTSRTSLSTPKRAVTLEEIIELARRKTSCDCEKPSSQKHYITSDDGELAVEEPAIQTSELEKDNEWTSGSWAYLEQLMELDADRISPSSEPPISVDNDDDIAFAASRQCTFSWG